MTVRLNQKVLMYPEGTEVEVVARGRDFIETTINGSQAFVMPNLLEADGAELDLEVDPQVEARFHALATKLHNEGKLL